MAAFAETKDLAILTASGPDEPHMPAIWHSGAPAGSALRAVKQGSTESGDLHSASGLSDEEQDGPPEGSEDTVSNIS